MAFTQWTGLGDATLWSDGTNWDDGAPGVGDTAYLAFGTTVCDIADIEGVTIAGGDHALGNAFTTEEMNITGGSFACGAHTCAIGGGGTPKLQISNGTFTGSTVTMGYLLQSGGTIQITSLTLSSWEGGTNKTLESTAGVLSLTYLGLTVDAKNISKTDGLSVGIGGISVYAIGGTTPTFQSDVTTVLLDMNSAGDTLLCAGGIALTVTLSTSVGAGTIDLSTATAVLGDITVLGGIITATNATVYADNVEATSGTITAPSGTFNCTGSWHIYGTSTFTDNNGTVEFNGTVTQYIRMAARGVFHNMKIDNAQSKTYLGGAMTIEGGIELARGELHFVGGNTYTFKDSSTSSFAAGTKLRITGTDGNLITLVTDVGGSACTWNKDAACDYLVQYASVKDNDASSGSTFYAADGTSTDATGNTNWVFTLAGYDPFHISIVYDPDGQNLELRDHILPFGGYEINRPTKGTRTASVKLTNHKCAHYDPDSQTCLENGTCESTYFGAAKECYDGNFAGGSSYLGRFTPSTHAADVPFALEFGNEIRINLGWGGGDEVEKFRGKIHEKIPDREGEGLPTINIGLIGFDQKLQKRYPPCWLRSHPNASLYQSLVGTEGAADGYGVKVDGLFRGVLIDVSNITNTGEMATTYGVINYPENKSYEDHLKAIREVTGDYKITLDRDDTGTDEIYIEKNIGGFADHNTWWWSYTKAQKKARTIYGLDVFGKASATPTTIVTDSTALTRYTNAETTLTADASSGQPDIDVADISDLANGDKITLNPGGGSEETLTVDSTASTTITFTGNLANAHSTGETIRWQGWTRDEFVDKTLEVTSGSAAGTRAGITANTPSTITVDENLGTAGMANGDKFIIRNTANIVVNRCGKSSIDVYDHIEVQGNQFISHGDVWGQAGKTWDDDTIEGDKYLNREEIDNVDLAQSFANLIYDTGKDPKYEGEIRIVGNQHIKEFEPVKIHDPINGFSWSEGNTIQETVKVRDSGPNPWITAIELEKYRKDMAQIAKDLDITQKTHNLFSNFGDTVTCRYRLQDAIDIDDTTLEGLKGNVDPAAYTLYENLNGVHGIGSTTLTFKSGSYVGGWTVGQTIRLDPGGANDESHTIQTVTEGSYQVTIPGPGLTNAQADNTLCEQTGSIVCVWDAPPADHLQPSTDMDAVTFGNYVVYLHLSSAFSRDEASTITWDDNDDANLATASTIITTVTGLTANTLYYIKIGKIVDEFQSYLRIHTTSATSGQ